MFNDSPFEPNDPAFTVAEAARVSQLTESDIRNWMRREVVPVGTKSRLGRIMFTAKDIVRLRVIGDLNKLLSVDPSNGNVVAQYIANHFVEWMQRENTHLHVTPDGFKVETRLLVHLKLDGSGPEITPVAWGESAFGFKVPNRGEGDAWARRPMLILPVEQIFLDVLNELFEIIEGENGD
tara:strand:- start:42 stop:581 length:540 start_codon:yes stop_codon:yes gene_type:complete